MKLSLVFTVQSKVLRECEHFTYSSEALTLVAPSRAPRPLRSQRLVVAAMFGGDDDDLQEVGCREVAVFADPWLGEHIYVQWVPMKQAATCAQSAVLKVSPARS